MMQSMLVVCTPRSERSELVRFSALEFGGADRAYVWDATTAYKCMYHTVERGLVSDGGDVLWCADDALINGPVRIPDGVPSGRTADGRVAWTRVRPDTLELLRVWMNESCPDPGGSGGLPPWPVAPCPDGIEPGGSAGRTPVRVAVVTPTVGGPFLDECVASVQAQDLPNVVHWIVVDGKEHRARVEAVVARYEGRKPIEVLVLPRNVGRAGGKNWYGHRVNAALPFLVDADYVCFLDEDNAFDPEHVRLLCRSVVASHAPWGHSLRRIVDEESRDVCPDACESLGGIAPSVLGDRLVDTSCFMLRMDMALRVAPHWYDARVDLRESDRRVLRALFALSKSPHAPHHAVSRHHSVRYRVYERGNGVRASFFLEGNARTGYDFSKPDLYVFGALRDTLRQHGTHAGRFNIIDGEAAADGDVGLPADAVVVCASDDWPRLDARMGPSIAFRSDGKVVMVVMAGDKTHRGVRPITACLDRARVRPHALVVHADELEGDTPGRLNVETFRGDDDLPRALSVVV